MPSAPLTRSAIRCCAAEACAAAGFLSALAGASLRGVAALGEHDGHGDDADHERDRDRDQALLAQVLDEVEQEGLHGVTTASGGFGPPELEAPVGVDCGPLAAWVAPGPSGVAPAVTPWSLGTR